MTYAPRVHFRALIWDGLFVFFEANFCFLVTCSFLYCFQSVVKIYARKGYNTGQVFPDELVWTFNKFFQEKNYISVF
jgi:hypothetical protein